MYIEKNVFKPKIPYIQIEDGIENSAQFFRHTLKFKNQNRELLIDSINNRQWTGAQLYEAAGKLACGFVELGQLTVEQTVFVISDHSDYELITALAVLISGGALFCTVPSDGYNEHKVACEILKPSMLCISPSLHNEILELRRNVPAIANSQIVWIDTYNCEQENNQNQQDSNNNCKESADFIVKRDNVLLMSNLLTRQVNVELLNDIADVILQPRHISQYMLTSGSTGIAKFVAMNQWALLNTFQSMYSCSMNPIPLTSEEEASTKQINNKESTIDRCMFPFDENTIFANDLPLEHGAGFGTTILSLLFGSKIVLIAENEPSAFLKAISEYKITASIASASFTARLYIDIARRLYQSKLTGVRDELLNIDSLQTIIGCGAPLPIIDELKQVLDNFKQLRIYQAYGTTETGFIACNTRHESKTFAHSVGYLSPVVEQALIVDPQTGEHLPANKKGELLISCQSRFTTYLAPEGNDGDALAAQVTHISLSQRAYYRTGDLAHFDEHGRLFLHTRIKETLYLDLEWKIAPAELETIVMQHPLVREAAVVGIRGYKLQFIDSPRAFVRLIGLEKILVGEKQTNDTDDQTKSYLSIKEAQRYSSILKDKKYALIEEEIAEFVNNKVAPAKRLTAGVKILDDFPRNGKLKKIDRNALRKIKMN